MRYTKFQRRYPVDYELLQASQRRDAELVASGLSEQLIAHRKAVRIAEAKRDALDDVHDMSIHNDAEYRESKRQQALGVRAYQRLKEPEIASWLPNCGAALEKLLDEGEAAIAAWERGERAGESQGSFRSGD